MRPRGSPSQLEARRWKAIKLLDQGLSLNEIGRRLGCGASSVMRWRNQFAREGREGLIAKPAAGRPRKLGEKQQRELCRIINKGARAAGFDQNQWTTLRIADLIQREYGVAYHPDHIGRLMAALGFQYVRRDGKPDGVTGWVEVGPGDEKLPE